MGLSDVLFRLGLTLRALRDELEIRTCKHPLYARVPHMRWIEEVVDFYETCTLCGKDLYE